MPVYFIGLMDFSLHSDSDGTFMFNYELIEKNSGEPMTARKLVERMGLSVSQAAEATGLSPEEFMNN